MLMIGVEIDLGLGVAVDARLLRLIGLGSVASGWTTTRERG